MGVTQKSWFRRNRFCRVTPAQFIRYLKSFYKANLDINKPLRLWVIIYAFFKFSENPLMAIFLIIGSALICIPVKNFIQLKNPNFKNWILPNGNKDVEKQTHILLVRETMQTLWVENWQHLLRLKMHIRIFLWAS